MTSKRLLTILLVILIALSATLVTVTAQDDGPLPLLTLNSPDPAHPVQFQAISPGDTPTTAGFTSKLAIPADADLDANIIYVAIENTGWSDGMIGLLSDALDPDAGYVALEVDTEGTPRDGGLAFELAYDDDLEGFVLPVLISQVRTFDVFRVVDADGVEFTGQTTMRDDGNVIQETVEISVDPEPVFASFLLECHIVARPIPIPEPTTIAPVVETGDEDTSPVPQTDEGGQSQPPDEPPATEEPPPPPPPPPDNEF